MHGNVSLESLLLRQGKANPISSEEIAKTVSEYKEVKQFAFEIVLDENMNRNKRQIKEFAIEKEVLCFLCHRRIKSSKMQKHNKDIHKGDLNTFGDEIVSFSSMKVFQGICKSENLYNGKERILGFALKVFCKSPNESVIECIGSVTELHTKPQRNCNFKRFET